MDQLNGLGALGVILTIVAFVVSFLFAVMAFLLPFFVYRIYQYVGAIKKDAERGRMMIEAIRTENDKINQQFAECALRFSEFQEKFDTFLKRIG